MKCKECKLTMEYVLGMWECDCGYFENPIDQKVSNSFLISDEEECYKQFNLMNIMYTNLYNSKSTIYIKS